MRPGVSAFVICFGAVIGACDAHRATDAGPAGPCPDVNHLRTHGLELSVHEFTERSKSEVLVLSDVVATGLGFVAVGPREQYGPMMKRSGEVWFSTDGHSWQQVARGGVLDGGDLRAIAAGTAYVIAGSIGEYDSQRQTLWFSSDGRTWTHAAEATLLPGELVDVAFGGDRFVAVGTSFVGGFTPHHRVGAIWVSPDGESWSSPAGQGPLDNIRFDFVEHTSVGFVAGGGQGFPGEQAVIWVSHDGDHWLPSATEFPEGSMLTAIAETRRGLFAVGGVYPFDGPGVNPNSIWTSADGSSWAVVSPSPSGAEANGWSAISASGEFVALFGTAGMLDSMHGTAWLSFDAGETWIPSPPDEQSARSYPIVRKTTVACPKLVGVGYVNDGKFVPDGDAGGVVCTASLVPES